MINIKIFSNVTKIRTNAKVLNVIVLLSYYFNISKSKIWFWNIKGVPFQSERGIRGSGVKIRCPVFLDQLIGPSFLANQKGGVRGAGFQIQRLELFNQLTEPPGTGGGGCSYPHQKFSVAVLIKLQSFLVKGRKTHMSWTPSNSNTEYGVLVHLVIQAGTGGGGGGSGSVIAPAASTACATNVSQHTVHT